MGINQNIFEHRKYIYIGLGIVLILTACLNIRTFQEISVSEELVLENSLKMTEIRSKYLSEYFESAELSLTKIRSILLNLTKSGKFDRELMNEMLVSNLNIDQDIRGIWIYLEPDAFDLDSEHINDLGSTESGRYAPWFYYDYDKTSIIKAECGTDQYDYYEYPKRLKREVLLEPYQTLNGGDAYFITLTQPVIQNKFRGAIGFDWFWEDFNKIISDRPLLKKSSSYLISQNGKILSHIDRELLGEEVDHSIKKQIKKVIKGEKVVEHNKERNIYRVITNFKIPYTETNWFLVNEIPDTNNIYAIIKQNRFAWRIGAFLFVVLLFFIYGLLNLVNYIAKDKYKVSREFADSIEALEEGFCVIGNDFKYKQLNNYYQLSGKFLWGRDIKIGDDAIKCLPEQLKKNGRQNFEKVLEGSFFIEEQIHQDRVYRYYYRPIYTEESLVESFSIRLVDVTDQSKNDEELENYRKNLQEIIKNKTADLSATVKAIKEARMSLVENERVATLGLLSSGLADELSIPLNFVVGNITPLKNDLEEIFSLIRLMYNEEQYAADQFMDAVKEQRKKIDIDILVPEIKSLLTSLELGTGRIKETITNFNELIRPDQQAKFENINRGVELAVEFLKARLPREISLVVDLESTLPATYCEVGKLNDAFLTVIDYNIKLLKEGEVRVETYTENVDFIVIKISNNSRKLTIHEIEHIFDPFLSIKNGEIQSGFKLAMCNKVIEAHGGSMKINNHPDAQGSEFTITIPILLKEV